MSVYQNNNNYINIINLQAMEDSSELTAAATAEKIAKLKQQLIDRSTSLEDLEAYQTFLVFI